MPPTQSAIDRLAGALRLETPLIAVYDALPAPEFEPLIDVKGRTCCFAYYQRWLQGTTIIIRKAAGGFMNPEFGCHGAQVSFGLSKDFPSFMAHFLTDGVGAPMGEGLKATPELAQEYIDRARPPRLETDTILIGPLRLKQWDRVKSVTFLADPDRIAALMTLAAYWSADPDFVQAPFSSGCGLLWRELQAQERDRAILGCTDIAMRKYLPPNILSISVTPKHFEKMTTFPDNAFLMRDWWNDLMKARGEK
jgi:hypothetical protein